MQKLDRLGWADGVSIHTYGRRVGVRTNDPSVLDRVRGVLPPGWEPCFSPLVDHLFSLHVGGTTPNSRRRDYHLLYGGFTQLARTTDLNEVLRTAQVDPEGSLHALERTVSGAHCLRGTRGEADATADALLQLMSKFPMEEGARRACSPEPVPKT
jgi:hypothetical protein